MSIRTEVEKVIKDFADAARIPVAFEGTPFKKPVDSGWLEVVFLDPSTTNPTLDGERIRKRGVFQINTYVLDGKGSRALEGLTESLTRLFPFHDKARYQTFSVEQTPNVSSPMIDGIFRWAAVRVKYRQELKF